jgi:hypothetical protein
MAECAKKCESCNNEEVKELTLDQALQYARMQMIAERLAAREDFNLLTQVIREHYITLRVAPYKEQYENLLKIWQDEHPENSEEPKKVQENVHNYDPSDYN